MYIIELDFLMIRNGHEITLTFGADVCSREASSAAENVKVIS